MDPAKNKATAAASQAVRMPSALRTVTVLAGLTGLVLAAGSAFAEGRNLKKAIRVGDVPVAHRGFERGFEGGQASSGPFTMLDAPIAPPVKPSAASRPRLAGSAIASVDGGVLVADADSGMLIRVANGEDKASASLQIGSGVSQLVVHPDGTRAFVVDRQHDAVVVVDLADGLTRVDAYRTHAEPYGVSITPDGQTLLVTAVADKSLTALNVSTGEARWTIEIGPEPRGVAISPDGSEAMVTFLTTGAVARVSLRSPGAPRAEYIAMDPGVRGQPEVAEHPDAGKSFARNAFAVGYIGHGIAVVPHQLSTPHLASEGRRIESSGYGGGSGFTPPISHRLAFVDTAEGGAGAGTRVAMAHTDLHQPRALAYDARTDTMVVAGFGSDTVMAIADVSQPSAHLQWQFALPRSSESSACGPTGLAVDVGTGEVSVWCSLSRRVVRLEGASDQATRVQIQSTSDELSKSHLSAQAQRGRALFRSGANLQISSQGAMACSSCHAEVRADGLSWRLQGKNLQTPFLAGRLEGAHPFKWDGKDPTLEDSLSNTVRRLGGSGISSTQVAELSAYLKTVDAPRKPTVASEAAVARGEALFNGAQTGCASCHSGPLMTDNQAYDLSTDLGEVDTPSLIGLANSAPYYHDGSAATLTALLRGNANVHGMGKIAKLSDTEIGDLVDYLKTL